MENDNIASNESVITEPTATSEAVSTTEGSVGSDLSDTSADKPVAEGGSIDNNDVWSEEFNMDGEAPVEDAPEAVEKVVDEPIDLDGLYSAQMDNKESALDKPILIKLNGKVTEITNINDMKDLMERGLGSTRKYQEMAEDRKTIEFMNNNGISMEDLTNLATSDGSVPIEQAPEPSAKDTQIQSVVDKISNSAYADQFKQGVAFLPDNVKGFISNSPELLDGLAGDFESGLAQQALPLVEKFMGIKGMEFIPAYTKAVEEVKSPKKNMLNSQPKSGSALSGASRESDVWQMSSDQFRKYM